MATAPIPSEMSQDDPWAWQAWAAQREPDIYGWKEQRETFQPAGGSSVNGPAWWGADIPGYVVGDDPHATMSPEQQQMLADAGYYQRTARGPGYLNLWQTVDKDGRVIDGGGFNRTQSLHSGDYAMFASVLAAGLGGAAYGASGGAAGAGGAAAAEGATAATAAAAAGDTAAAWGAGAGLGADTVAAVGGGANWGAIGNAALRGAAMNGGMTAVRGGSLTDILRSAATGAATGGAGSYIGSLGYSPIVSQAATGAIGAAARGGSGRDIATGAVLGGVNGAMSGWQPTGNAATDAAIRGGVTSAVRGGNGQQILTGAANGAIGTLGSSANRSAPTGGQTSGGPTMSDIEYGSDPNLGGYNFLGGNAGFDEAAGGLTFDNLGTLDQANSGQYLTNPNLSYQGGDLTFDGQGIDYGAPSLWQQAGNALVSGAGRMFAGGGNQGGGQQQQRTGGGSYLDMMGLMLAGGMAGNALGPNRIDTSQQRGAGEANLSIGNEQTALARQQVADQQQIFAQYRPMFDQLIGNSLRSQSGAQGQADQMWADYNSTWRPISQELASRTTEMASQGRIDQEAARAGSEATGRYDAAAQETRRALIAAGASPEKIAAIEAAGRLESARGVAGATSTARREGENRALAILDNGSRFGMTMPNQSLSAAQSANQAGQAVTSGYQNLAAAAAQPATAAAPIFNSAVNANQSAGSLFSAATAAETANDIARTNATLGGAGAGMQMWQQMNPPKP